MARLNLALGQNFGQELCEIFGLDKNLVNHLSIEIALDHIVTVTTTRYVTEPESDKLTALFKSFYLVEREEDKSEAPA